jgi:lipoate-protein ligase A
MLFSDLGVRLSVVTPAFLLRSRPADTPLCLLYRNEPCIVIGRNQNPWNELDVTRMKEMGIKLVRRRSGGGAVYHVSKQCSLLCRTCYGS